MVVAQQKPPVAAYIPFKTLEGVTETLEQEGVPPRIDRSMFPTFSGSVQSWVLSAFEFLGFTDADGIVQPRLRRWIDESDTRPSIMREIIGEKYAPVVALADRKGTPQQMREEIEKLGVSGTTSQKAVRFYLAASEFAGMPVPATWKKARVSVGTGKRRRRRTRTDGAPEETEPEPEKAPDTGPGSTVALGEAGTVTLKTDINLMALEAGDRDWLFRLIDHFHSYESSEEPGEIAASEEGDDDA